MTKSKALAFLFTLCASSALFASVNWPRYSLLRPASGVTALKPEEFKKIERLLWVYHPMKPMDNAWKLASAYGTNVQSIQSTNASELIWVRPGYSIIIHNKRGTLHKVKIKDGRGETISEIAAFYKPKDKDAQEKLKQAILIANDLGAQYMLGNLSLKADSFVLVPNTYLQFDTFRIPFNAWSRISSGFGMRFHPILKIRRFHEGLDFPKPYGTPVYAARSGRIVHADWMEGYGLCVIVKHSDGTTSLYGHLSKVLVVLGQTVERGKKMIGRVGSSGLSTGPHLHFEIRDQKGHPINPVKKLGRM